MNIILGILGCACVIFLLVILVRAAMYKPVSMPPVQEEKIELNQDKIVTDMVDMIRCKTISNRDENLVDRGEFEKFEKLMEERFPNIYKKCEFKKIGKTGLLYFLKGKSSEKPSVCMAHYDVVPVEEEGWSKPAFEGIIEDGVLWGRGTLDTKGTLCGVVEALEQLLESDYVPENDLYLSFSGEEEIDGNSCSDIVTYLQEKGVKPALILDEGAEDVWAGTFHSVCGKMLRRFGDVIGYSPRFTIYDTDDQKRLMKEVYRELGLEDKMIPIKSALNAISRAKDMLIEPEEYIKINNNR